MVEMKVMKNVDVKLVVAETVVKVLLNFAMVAFLFFLIR